MGARYRGADLPPVPHRGADAPRGPARPGRFRRAHAPPRPRGARPLGHGGCRLRAARLARAPARARGRPACRPRLRWWSSQRALGSHPRLGPRPAHPAHGDRRGLRIWSGVTRRRGRRSLSRRPRGRRHLCPSARPGRAGRSVVCRLRARLPSLSTALSSPSTLGGRMTVKWGILSTADINRKVIPGAHASEKAELIAVASRDQRRAEEYAREWEIDRAYGSYEALLEDGEVE